MGSITLVMGPMFSGKTTELMRRIRMSSLAKKRCCVLKYCKDQRYGDGIVSHDASVLEENDSVKVIASGTLLDIQVDSFDVIGVDEGQFFGDLADACSKWALAGKTVYVSALDGDFLRKPFLAISELIPLCDSVTKLQGVCMVCRDAPSIFSKRVSDSMALVLIGGAESYQTVCRLCFK
jgi:thymidine kinase